MKFKIYVEKDLSPIVEVNQRIFDGMYGRPPYSLEEYKERLEGKFSLIVIAEENGKIVGDVIGFEKEESWYVWVLGIIESYRNQGIATQLLRMQEEYAWERRYKMVTMKVHNVSKEMLRLVEKRGYRLNETKENWNYLSLTFTGEDKAI